MNIVELATRRRVTIAMFTLATLVFGLVSLSQLKINLLPDLSYPTLTVRTEYVGAAPVEIENLITKPIEEALGVVKNVKQLRSISRSGQSDVTLEFEWGANMDIARQDVRENLDALSLPLDAQSPLILRFDPSLDPIVRLGFYSTGRPDDSEQLTRRVADSQSESEATEALTLLRRFADEEIKKSLEAATGVAAVKVSGGFEDEVQILVDQKRLAQLSLPIERVSDVLRAENVNMSGGRLEEGTQEFLVRTVNQFTSVEEMADVIIETRGGRPVYLRDIAEVRLGHKEREAITRMNGREAIEIAVYKEGDANTVAVASAIKQRFDSIQRDLLDGTSMKMEIVYDQSVFINSAIREVVNAGMIGGLLAIIILYLFLGDFRSTVIIGLSIPISVIATFLLMFWSDLTLNIMSLGGLALGIGLLVDNSIVVLENIARHRDMGKSNLISARDGASEVATAVIASTLTTIAVFFPLVFVSGIAGQLFKDQALTVTFSLLASLVVALTLIPMMTSIGGKATSDKERETQPPKSKLLRPFYYLWKLISLIIPSYIGKIIHTVVTLLSRLLKLIISPLSWAFKKFFVAVSKVYRPILSWSLSNRIVVVATAFILLALSLLLVRNLGVELIPQMDQGEFVVDFRLPQGTPLQSTDAALASLQDSATENPFVRSTFAVAGSGNRLNANPDEGGENWGELHVTLTDGAGDAAKAEAVDALREAAQNLPGAEYKFEAPTLFTFATPIEVEVSGFDLAKLKSVSGEIASRMTASDRFADVKSTMEAGHPELQIIFDRERAAALDISVHDIADRVVNHVRGTVATRYSWRDRKIDVLVRARDQDRSSVDKISQLVINPESERPVPLSSVATIFVENGPGEIRRSSQQRVALITANKTFGDLGDAVQEIEGIISGVSIPTGLTVRMSGQSEEMSASFRSLLFALLLAVFLVYLVMASQFESLIHPFVIFFSIPLAAIGAILALWLTGSTISVVVFIGFILLAGIVVNNAIVLVDLINKLRENGLPRREAIEQAGALRLRPILMTTLTTALGLLPLALGFGDGAEIRAPMAVTVIGGLLVATLLTLVVIPVMYSLLDRDAPVRQEVAS